MRVQIQADLNEMAVHLAELRDAANDLNRRLHLLDATWEPHDWSDF